MTRQHTCALDLRELELFLMRRAEEHDATEFQRLEQKHDMAKALSILELSQAEPARRKATTRPAPSPEPGDNWPQSACTL